MVKLRIPKGRLVGLIPRNGKQAEASTRTLLKLLFWAALLAPVVLVPAYYLLVAFGLLPQVHLPG